MPGEVKAARRYVSPHRQAQARATRQAILTAAHHLFAERGYPRTSVDDVAAAAGVARQTVFSSVGNKSVLLKEVIDVALAGDDEPIPVQQRPWFRRMMAAPEAADVLRHYARGVTRMADRVCDVYFTTEAAAGWDEETAKLWQSLKLQRLMGARVVVDQVIKRQPLRAGLSRAAAVDVTWLLVAPGQFRMLVREREWSKRRFERWLGGALGRELLED